MKTLPHVVVTQKLRDRFWSKVDKSRGDNACWVWMACKDKHGYGRMSSRKGYAPFKAYRIAWEIVVGPILNGAHVLHKCDNPSCCNPSHLFLGTHKDNMDDMTKKGRAKVPGKVRAKMSVLQVLEIRERRSLGESATNLAREFKISRNQIRRICLGLSWKEVSDGRV